ncbi:MAG TPA: hypothetical protein VGG79_14025 [Roseiarcus sp.]
MAQLVAARAGRNMGGAFMLTRRLFTACGLCAAAGFLASGAEAQTAAPPGLKRTLIKQTDGPMDGYATIEMRIELAPNAPIARHTIRASNRDMSPRAERSLRSKARARSSLARATDFRRRPARLMAA